MTIKDQIAKVVYEGWKGNRWEDVDILSPDGMGRRQAEAHADDILAIKPEGWQHFTIGDILRARIECPKGGNHEWGTDGMHQNVFCKKCFRSKEDE